MILTGKVSNNGGVKKSNCSGEEQHPLSFLLAVELDYSVAEAPPHNVQGFFEGVGVVVHDSQQFGRHPLLHHLLQGGQPRTDNRTCFPNQLIQSVGVLYLDICVPAHHSKDGARKSRLI